MIDTPEYLAALAEERRLREEIYLDLPRDICGIEVKQITPHLRAVLFNIGSPFITEGSITTAHILQFLWACSTDYSTSRFARWRFMRRASRINLIKAANQIEEFLDDTFLDAPYGGKKSVPYVSSLAWIEVAMRRIMGWGIETTMHTPLRRIYQLIRCERLEKGDCAIINARSDYERDRSMHAANGLGGRN
jgi:hypothetical protein